MKAISVFSGKLGSAHLADAPKPSLDQISNGEACSSKSCASGSMASMRKSTPPRNRFGALHQSLQIAAD